MNEDRLKAPVNNESCSQESAAYLAMPQLSKLKNAIHGTCIGEGHRCCLLKGQCGGKFDAKRRRNCNAIGEASLQEESNSIPDFDCGNLFANCADNAASQGPKPRRFAT